MLAVLSAAAAFWLVLPLVLLGVAAVGLGLRARRSVGLPVRARELAAAGMAFGLAGMLYVPAGYVISEGGEQFGRDCALQPDGEHC